MARQRRPMSVNLSNPKNHYTKAQIESRESSEAKVPRPKSLKCPKWLGKEPAKLFRSYAKGLIANLPVSELDTLTLARMCDAEWSYAEASKHKSCYLLMASQILDAEAEKGSSNDILANAAAGQDHMAVYKTCQEQIAYWSKQMSLFEKFARGAASDLGCTITSRCRLVVPQTGESEEEDPLEQLQRELMRIV